MSYTKYNQLNQRILTNQTRNFSLCSQEGIPTGKLGWLTYFSFFNPSPNLSTYHCQCCRASSLLQLSYSRYFVCNLQFEAVASWRRMPHCFWHKNWQRLELFSYRFPFLYFFSIFSSSFWQSSLHCISGIIVHNFVWILHQTSKLCEIM